ncbi:MAG: hypothetical protein HGA87_00260 [Desulfobulbaceae bacterium]|jgi:hypothetical protein|nr:hypothetical protein [Desulfobulbaceae bacterium]NTU49327.1 hypothetical protein [Desulfobulbaceae bacterium]
MTKEITSYVIVRTASAGVFAGYLKLREGREVTLTSARRLWYWSGAASLSQLANDGVSNPDKCKFPAEVPEVLLLEAIEILPASEQAKISIKEVPVWKV